MRGLVPPQLTLDTWDETAWVGVVPFRMQGVRPRFVAAVPWLSAFAELNLRTYVTIRDRGIEKHGVYFFSLEAANPVAVAIARALFKLPYFNAAMTLRDDGRQIHYRSRRTHHNAAAAEFVGSYGPTGPLYRSEPGSFDAWLTERYALYTTGLTTTAAKSNAPRTVDTPRNNAPIYIGEIHHERWPLQPATATIQTNSIATASGFTLPDQPPILHFTRHIDVVVWPLRPVEP